jgi:hypothetical protein
MFQTFSCTTLHDGESWLDVDLQVDCESLEYLGFQTMAFVGVGVYPIGIPVVSLLFLMRYRKDIRDGGPARDTYEFLVTDYKPQFYFWDCLEMLRKVTITGLLIFVSRGSFFQLLVATIASLCFGFGLGTPEVVKPPQLSIFRSKSGLCGRCWHFV